MVILEVSSIQTKKYVIVANPICITPDHVLGLIESVYSLGGRIDSEELNNIIDVDMDILTHAIDIAEALNLVRFDQGNIELTELGIKVAKATTKEIKKILRERALNLEPLHTLINEIKNNNGRIEISRVREIIATFYGENNIEHSLDCLRQWWRYLEILSRHGNYLKLTINPP
ncbi:ABC nitrate/sulphonate/bicarbonate family transporter, ATPase subunit [Ignisphaera aggregans DSM 17230]|uniref:ABC nitrate/sulphonate/bicarbonate family transporter, ATPase subunit n=1 Tax=Ignisphaera aggregans (strain DSM 17230 / JCM 13409 / AQ1.S1) TaxID=583356 RepID=E0SQ85_IGNAA|nr:ABC nitrate/sulphonate/bicarbonate family transporter, ATPase subunit [Ignisphaera aggregans DSM 17230]